MIERSRPSSRLRRRLRRALDAGPRQSAGWLLAAVVGLTTAMVVADEARAGQSRPPVNTWRSQQQSVGDADLEDLKRTLNLDESQTEIIALLIDGYVAAFQEGTRTIREETTRLREDARARNREGGPIDPQMWSDIAAAVEKLQTDWAVTAEKLEADLFRDIKSVLTEEQVRDWPRFERERRRRTTLSTNTRLSYEGLDLILLIRELALEPAAVEPVAPTLETYANELDLALQERNRVAEVLESKMRELAESQRFGELNAHYQAAHQRRIVLAEVNERYVPVIADRLPAEAKERFEQLVRETAFPRIYRASQAERYAEYVLGLQGLAEDQVTAITGMIEQHRQRVQPINLSLEQYERQRELEPPTAFFEHDRSQGGATSGTTALSGRQPQNHDVARQLWADRRALEASLMDQIFSSLTPDQQVQAPKGRTQAPRRPSELAP